MTVQSPVCKSFEDMSWKHWLSVSKTLCRIIFDDTRDQDTRLARREDVVRFSEKDFGRCCAVREVKVHYHAEEAGQTSFY